MASDSTLPRDRKDAAPQTIQLSTDQLAVLLRQAGEEGAAAVIARLGKAVVDAAGGTVPVDQNAREAAQQAEQTAAEDWLKAFKAVEAKPHAETDGVAPLANDPNPEHNFAVGTEFVLANGDKLLIEAVSIENGLSLYTVRTTPARPGECKFTYTGMPRRTLLDLLLRGNAKRLKDLMPVLLCMSSPSITDGVPLPSSVGSGTKPKTEPNPTLVHRFKLGTEFVSASGNDIVIDDLYNDAGVLKYTIKVAGPNKEYFYAACTEREAERNIDEGRWQKKPAASIPSITDGVAETTLGVTGEDSNDSAPSKKLIIERAINLLFWIASVLDSKVMLDRYQIYPARYGGPVRVRDHIDFVLPDLRRLIEIPTDRDGGETIVSLGQGDCMVNYRGNPVTGKITSETPTQSERPLGTHIDTKA